MKSIADIKAIREKMQAQIISRDNESEANEIRVVVGMATCGIAAGARPVFNELVDQVANRGIKHVVLTGAARYNMLSASGEIGYSEVTVTESFSNAVKIANLMADKGDCVLLSPACASFDCFKNFEERGDEFFRIVREEL